MSSAAYEWNFAAQMISIQKCDSENLYSKKYIQERPLLKSISADKIEKVKLWLDGEEECKILFWDDEVLNVELPTFVTKTVAETEPGLKGDTVSNTSKPAKLLSGLEVQVPIFINEGEQIKIDTRDGTYVGRSKE